VLGDSTGSITVATCFSGRVHSGKCILTVWCLSAGAYLWSEKWGDQTRGAKGVRRHRKHQKGCGMGRKTPLSSQLGGLGLWSNYIIVYERAVNMASDSEPRKFLSPSPFPRSRQKSFLGAKSFCTAISVHSNTNCNKASIKKLSAHHNFRGGDFQDPLSSLKTDVSQGTSGFSGGLGPSDLHVIRLLVWGASGVPPAGSGAFVELSEHVWTHTANFGQSCISTL